MTRCEYSKYNPDSDLRARVGGLLKRMKLFNCMCGRKLSKVVLDHTDNLSATLQTTYMYAGDAQETARLVVDTITRMQNEQYATSYDMSKSEQTSFP